MAELESLDRYVSFEGLDCDWRADQFLKMLLHNIESGNGEPHWHQYFLQKIKHQEMTGQDNLYFVGSQMNALYEYLEGCEDKAAQDLLYQLEQECC